MDETENGLVPRRKYRLHFFFISILVWHGAYSAEYTQTGSYAGASTDANYSSVIPHDPNATFFPVLNNISGINKFDSSMGTLTNVLISVSANDPIYYDLVATLTVRPNGSGTNGFSGNIAPIVAEVGIFQEVAGNLFPLFTEFATLPSSGCSGEAGESFCAFDPIYPDDFMLHGEVSILNDIEPGDFVGDGEVGNLFWAFKFSRRLNLRWKMQV